MLIHCYACDADNHSAYVMEGHCAYCGWDHEIEMERLDAAERVHPSTGS